MNQAETQNALEATRSLRGTIEETKQLLEAFSGARQHFAIISDDLAYKVEVLRERVEKQDVGLALIERMLKLSAV